MNKDMKTGDFFHEWFEIFSEPNIRPSTAVNYEGYIRNYIVPSPLGNTKICDIKFENVQMFFNDLKPFLSAKTILNIRQMMHKEFKAAVLNDFISKNYIEYVTIAKVTKPKIRVLSYGEEKNLLDAVTNTDNPYDFGIFLCLFTGMRIGEICALKWKYISLALRHIEVRETLERIMNLKRKPGENSTMIYIGPPKSENSDRDIPISEYLILCIIRYRKLLRQKYGKFVDNDDSYVITKNNGRYVEPKTLQKYTQKVFHNLHINNATFHSLRHTFATRALEANVNIKALSELLGHSSIQITIDTYAHVVDKFKRSSIDIITQYIIEAKEEIDNFDPNKYSFD